MDFKLVDTVRLQKFKDKLLNKINTDVTAISSAIATEETNRNTAISNAIATEATNRDAAISSAIATEETNRNTAISSAIPTKVSAFQNDSGYLTSHQSLDDYAKTADIEGTPKLINDTSTTFISSCQLTNGKLSAEWKYLPTASTTGSGIVQLSSATDSDAEDVAATSKAVKEAYNHYPTLGTSAVSCGASSPFDFVYYGENSAGTSTSVARADHKHMLRIPRLSNNNDGIVEAPRQTDYFQVLTSGYYYSDGSFYLNPEWNTPNFNVKVSVLKANCFYDVGYTFTPNTTTYRPPTFYNSVNSISVEYDYFHNKLYIKANLSSSYNSSGGTTQITKCGIHIKKLFNTTFQKILFQTSNPQTNEWQRIRYTVNGCESAMTNADGDAKFEFTNYYNNAEDVYIISDIYLTS